MSPSLSWAQMGTLAINILIFLVDGQTLSLWVDKEVYPISHGPDMVSQEMWEELLLQLKIITGGI